MPTNIYASSSTYNIEKQKHKKKIYKSKQQLLKEKIKIKIHQRRKQKLKRNITWRT